MSIASFAERCIEALEQHPGRAFVVKALLLVVLLELSFAYLGFVWLALFLFAPVFAYLLACLVDLQHGRGLRRTLLESLTLLPIPYVERDSLRDRWAPVTLGLILINIAVFYLLQSAPLEIDWDNWIFVPADPGFWNVLLSLVTCVFLHADPGHLWGNMLFLWAFGVVVERHIGSGPFLGLYLATAVIANLVEVAVVVLVTGELTRGLGASGAISGVMGLYAVRCYFTTIIFPFPVLGLFSYVFPLHFKVRMNALVLIGLFFWSDLSGGLAQLADESGDNVAYWCHLGGLLGGMLLAWRLKFARAARTESHLVTARTALAGREFFGVDKGEAALRLYLQEQPDDPEALVLLGEQLTRHAPDADGHTQLQRAVELLLAQKPERALEVFRDYFNRHCLPLRPDLQYRLAIQAERSGDLHFASRCLEALLPLAELPPALRQRCLFHCRRLCKLLGLEDAAAYYDELYQAQV